MGSCGLVDAGQIWPPLHRRLFMVSICTGFEGDVLAYHALNLLRSNPLRIYSLGLNFKRLEGKILLELTDDLFLILESVY